RTLDQIVPIDAIVVVHAEELVPALHLVAVRSDYLMHFGIAQVGGEHGNQVERWNELLGVDNNNRVDWHNLVERPSFLNALGARYIVSGIELGLVDITQKQAATGIEQIYKGSAFVYLNHD